MNSVRAGTSTPSAGEARPSTAARSVPPSAELELLLAGSPSPGPCLANIETYYRLALAYIAEQKLEQARACLTTVAEISPDYRDVEQLLAGLGSPPQGAAESTARGSSGPSAGRRYSLIKEVGRGRRAIVYQAHDVQLDREVALKVLIDESPTNPSFLDYFEAQAKAAASLNHLHTVRIWDIGVLDDRVYVALEPVEGRTLESILLERSPFDIREAVEITVQILNALEYAHDRGIIHRDVRASNVMQAPSGAIKLMDLRFGRSTDRATNNSSVASKMASCTSPEQLEDKPLDARTDLFAVGALLFEMLTGRPPFSGLDRNSPPPALSSLRAEVSAALDGVVQRALAPNRDERFETAAEMRRALREAFADLSNPSLRTPSMTPPSGRVIASERPRRSRGVIEETVISRSNKDNR